MDGFAPGLALIKGLGAISNGYLLACKRELYFYYITIPVPVH